MRSEKQQRPDHVGPYRPLQGLKVDVEEDPDF